MPAILTIETNKNDSTVTIGREIVQNDIKLVSYRADVMDSKYKHLGIDIEGIISGAYLVDNQTGSKNIRIPLGASAPQTIDGVASVISTFVPECSHELTMNKNLPSSFELKVFYLDRTVTPHIFKLIPTADLKYLSLTFQIP